LRSNIESFKYDPFGRRIYKSSSSGTSIFAYDGESLIEETNVSGAVVARYSQTENIDEPLAMLRSGATSFYHADGLGTVTSLSNTAGALAQTYAYDSFGKQTSSSGSLMNAFQYTGRELDAETGLYYYRARYYDASAGKFMSEDPIQFAGGANFYRFVSNNAVNFRDPLGLCPLKDPCEVPTHPWYASVDDNIADSLLLGPQFQFAMVLPHMPWDYKQQGPYDDFGNFNFGATGAALGYPDSVLLRGAGALKGMERRVRHQPIPPRLGSPLGAAPYGNEPEKQKKIQEGIDYYKNGCTNILRVLFRIFL
jgi:RHS repeat-associated protein